MNKTLTGRLTSILKPAQAPAYPMADFERFVVALRDAKIDLLAADRFARRYAAYQARDYRLRGSGHSFGLLKFDIHGNVRQALEMARVLAGLGIPGLFLMMHRHPLNSRIFDSAKTWRALREIARSGSEVGIHIDPFYLIRTHGDLYTGLKTELLRFHEERIAIRVATSHGDTRAHIKARNLNANDFFKEERRKSRWDGMPPKGEKYIAKHVGRYSYRKLASAHGIKYFAEPSFLHKGERLNDRTIAYLSDNSHRIAVQKLRGKKLLAADEPFRITESFTDEIVPRLTREPFIALFHPQWYR